MLNFRKIKQDFPPSILKDGRALYEKKMVVQAKILHLNAQTIRLSCRVAGSFNNYYQSEIEIDRIQSSLLDSDCHCPYKYDCQHLAAIIFYLEENLSEIVVAYSKESNLEAAKHVTAKEKASLKETFKEAESREVVRKGRKQHKELLQEYISASEILGQSPFFQTEEQLIHDKAELVIIFNTDLAKENSFFEIQMALRLPYRSKCLQIPNIKEFLDGIKYKDPLYIGSKRFFFTLESFDPPSIIVLRQLLNIFSLQDARMEKNPRVIQLDAESFGNILAESYELAHLNHPIEISQDDYEPEGKPIPCLYCGNLEEPLRYSLAPARLRILLEYLEVPSPKILLNPKIVLPNNMVVDPKDVKFLECAKPGIIYQKSYSRFSPNIKRKHLRAISDLQSITIPEPLFGTFVENSLQDLLQYGEVADKEVIERFVTIPFVDTVVAECDINYLKGELEASVSFIYGKHKIPFASSLLSVNHVTTFVTSEGILARNLTEEQRIIQDLFQDFQHEPNQGLFIARSDKKIVEFMTEVIPRNQDRVKFNCPENLLDQFLYDNTKFKLHCKETNKIDQYEVELKVDGYLNGLTIDVLWECIATKRAFIEISKKKEKKKSTEENGCNLPHKILVLDLEKLTPVVQIFDEIGIQKLDDHKEMRPLWSLTSIDPSLFEGLPIEFSISSRLLQIQKQMLGITDFMPNPIPPSIQATLRSYQIDGINWLNRLRAMHLNGILADDMGLGKTLQAIVAVTQNHEEGAQGISLIVCPTSLVHNWKEEFSKFNPNLKVLPVDGSPMQRKKLLNDVDKYDVVITSYSLMQKDIDIYKAISFSYVILDEAQHIKNRGTRNAKSVKMIQAFHRLILTGTPIENSLDELWSLFDFLMPGLLSTYDRFVEKYIRNPAPIQQRNMEVLRKKLSPFILRRMKSDVLTELPPVSEMVYYCDLSETQKELYRSYAESAREELSQLVRKEGFEKVQIHVLATLTRLKQICCHPAIFAKEKAEKGDSAKYDMLMELLHTLMEGKHKTVIFSQYTRMLNIIREDLLLQGIQFEYLDGTTKNRLGIVKKFNEDDNIPVFLVSLKAGGSGLNLVGANAVIHADLWWNPAVENQATDRVHRIGQKNPVSSYKLITLNTIEEKILELQNRKKGLVKQVVSCDEEAIAKLTWEEVLDLLKT